jgi:hypothetical protein
MSENMTSTDIDPFVAKAREIGAQHGRNAASWVEVSDGGTARRILQGIEEGDPEILDGLPSADLSGQWADGFTVAQLVAEVDAPADNEDDLIPLSQTLADVYVEAFSEGAEHAVTAACLGFLDDQNDG